MSIISLRSHEVEAAVVVWKQLELSITCSHDIWYMQKSELSRVYIEHALIKFFVQTSEMLNYAIFDFKKKCIHGQKFMYTKTNPTHDQVPLKQIKKELSVTNNFVILYYLSFSFRN